MALESVGGRQTFFGALPSKNKFGGEVASSGVKKELRFPFSYDDLPAVDADNEMLANLPAGSIITAAYVIVDSAMTGSSGTLTIGTYQADGGGAIDLDGIDVAIAQAVLIANTTIVCDGAQVGGGIVLAEKATIVAVTGGTVTAGAFTLVVEYISS
tara:strand:+ start:6821 stop:7288 length:468 start_codon:yes stop_codon:yes gene_type:complete